MYEFFSSLLFLVAMLARWLFNFYGSPFLLSALIPPSLPNITESQIWEHLLQIAIFRCRKYSSLSNQGIVYTTSAATAVTQVSPLPPAHRRPKVCNWLQWAPADWLRGMTAASSAAEICCNIWGYMCGRCFQPYPRLDLLMRLHARTCRHRERGHTQAAAAWVLQLAMIAIHQLACFYSTLPAIECNESNNTWDKSSHQSVTISLHCFVDTRH